MLPKEQFIRECKVWGLFFLGIATLALGLIRWPRASFAEHIIILVFTPIFFAGSYFYERILVSKRQKASRSHGPAVRRMNPPAELPPLRRR